MGLNFWLHLLFQDKSVEKDITNGTNDYRMSEDHKDCNRGDDEQGKGSKKKAKINFLTGNQTFLKHTTK